MAAKKFLATILNESYLICLPLFFVFKQFNENNGAISIADALWMGGLYFIMMIILRILFVKWHKGKAACMVIIISIIFLFFGFFQDSLKLIFPGSLFASYSFLLPVVLLLVFGSFLLVKRNKSGLLRLLKYFNLLFALLLLFELTRTMKNPETSTPEESTLFNKCDSCASPDIYFIVSDEYAGQQQLQEVFHFDNSVFLKALENRGFTVIPDSRSNYNSTSYSLASFFNLDYIKISSEKENQEDIDRNIKNIEENSLVQFLQSLNYRVYNYSVFNIGGQQPPHSSMFFIRGKRRIHFQTLAGRLEKDLEFHLVSSLKWNFQLKRMAGKRMERTEDIIDQVKKTAALKTSEPKFIYAHFMMPHFPYLLDSNGKLNELNSLVTEDWTNKNEYIGYLKYSNKRFLELFDHIQKLAGKASIIIFMSDHGFRYMENKPGNQPYHFMNISAVHFPDGQKGKFYSGITTLNQARVIMNQVFDQKLPMRKDSTVFIH